LYLFIQGLYADFVVVYDHIPTLYLFIQGLYADSVVVYPLKPILETKKLSGLG